MEENENTDDKEELKMGELLITEKIDFTQRLLNAASALFGQFFGGIAMIFVAPFAAIRILCDSERQVMDINKLPVDLFSGGMGPPPAGFSEGMHMDMGSGDIPKDIMDLFDAREPWKKEHDDMYGDDGEPKN